MVYECRLILSVFFDPFDFLDHFECFFCGEPTFDVSLANISWRVVAKITKNYVARRLHGEKIEPMLSFDPETQAEHAKVIEETGED